MARIWREGQKRQVHLYRLVTANGLEERIFQRQIAKCSLTQSAMEGTSIFKTVSSRSSAGTLTKDELRVGQILDYYQNWYLHENAIMKLSG